MTNTKKVYNEPKNKKQYNDPKLGLIDRLTVKLMNKQHEFQVNEDFKVVTNIRRFISYLIDFFFANVLAVIPLVIIQSKLTGSTNTTQVLTGLPIVWVYIITILVFVVYTLYYVVIPWKVWPGQTPAKRLIGYKIVMKDGSDPTLKALFLRNVIAMTFIEGAAFTTTYAIQLVVLTMKIDYPAFVSTICYFMTLLSVLVTMTNPQRRMIHDYVGGTMVCMVDKEKKEAYKAL